jgi:hypothetical protein
MLNKNYLNLTEDLISSNLDSYNQKILVKKAQNAIETDNLNEFILLLDSGLNLSNNDIGDLMLLKTCSLNSIEIAKYLIETRNKLNIDILQRINGPLRMAINNNNYEIAESLFNHLGSNKTILGEIIMSSSFEKINLNNNYTLFKLCLKQTEYIDMIKSLTPDLFSTFKTNQDIIFDTIKDIINEFKDEISNSTNSKEQYELTIKYKICIQKANSNLDYLKHGSIENQSFYKRSRNIPEV